MWRFVYSRIRDKVWGSYGSFSRLFTRGTWVIYFEAEKNRLIWDMREVVLVGIKDGIFF